MFFEHGCSEGDERNEVVKCSKCHFRFFTTAANDGAGHFPVPFDITPFSFTSTMTDRTHKRDWIPFAICTSPIIHLVCPQTFCIRIEFNFSWDDYNTQEKLKAKVMQNFRRQTTCITRVVQMGNAVIEKRSLFINVLHLLKTPHLYSW